MEHIESTEDLEDPFGPDEELVPGEYDDYGPFATLARLEAGR